MAEKIKLSLLSKYFDLIKIGVKTVEGRLATKKYEDINNGDYIEFHSVGDEHQTVTCAVTKKSKYKSFQEMLETEGLDACLPGVNDVAEGINIYRSFPGYAEKEQELGVIAFQIKLLT